MKKHTLKNIWKCKSCGNRYKGLNNLKIKKPSKCENCGSTDFS